VSCAAGINLVNGISAMGGGDVLYLKEEGRLTDRQTFCARENQKTSSHVLYSRHNAFQSARGKAREDIARRCQL
jgi:hypothetical protein